MFDNWCHIGETARRENKKLCLLEEKAGGRAAIMDEIVERVRSHYDKIEEIAEDVERLGFPGASAILGERLPRTQRARSGELGEIIATEFIEFYTGFRIPVRRLRYKDGREMALRGDDFIGVSEDDNERLLFLKGESKSRNALSNAVVTDARQKLSADDGRPTPISLLFVADRLLEDENGDHQELGRRIRDEVALKTVPPQRIMHGLFALSGNTLRAILEDDLEMADGAHSHISVGFHVVRHQAFIAEIYEKAGDLGNN
jgi:hypothetical protein